MSYYTGLEKIVEILNVNDYDKDFIRELNAKSPQERIIQLNKMTRFKKNTNIMDFGRIVLGDIMKDQKDSQYYEKVSRTPLWNILCETSWSDISVDTIEDTIRGYIGYLNEKSNGYINEVIIEEAIDEFRHELYEIFTYPLHIVKRLLELFGDDVTSLKDSTFFIDTELFKSIVDVKENIDLYAFYIIATENQEMKQYLTDFLHTSVKVEQYGYGFQTGRTSLSNMLRAGIVFPYTIIPIVNLFGQDAYDTYIRFLEEGTNLNSQNIGCIRDTLSTSIVNIFNHVPQNVEAFIRIIKYMISRGANPHQKRLLLSCLTYDQLDILKILVEEGLDISQFRTKTVFRAAIMYASVELFRYCLDNGLRLVISEKTKKNLYELDQKIMLSIQHTIDPSDIALCLYRNE